MGLKTEQTHDFFHEAATSINEFISKYLNWQDIEDLAIQTKFVMRRSAILRGYEFLLMSLICSKGDSHNTLEDMVDILEKYSNIEITKQSLADKIDSTKALDFLSACLRSVLRKKVNFVLDNTPPDALMLFSKILLQDSTTINLHEKLSEFFKGSGGRASISALKIDLIYDLKSKEFVSFIITDMKTADQYNSKEILEFIDAGTLVIRDLGYLQVDVFQKIIDAKAYFLSRFKSGYLVYLNIEDTQPIDLAVFLEKEFKTKKIVDLNVYITKKKLPVRLVAYHCPEEVINQRLRTANAAAKKQGRRVTETHKTLSKYTIYITNVPISIWKPEIVGTIYGLRWQIELIFKCWKSVCHIHVLTGTKPNRINVLILGRLLQLLIYTIIYKVIQSCCELVLKRDVSMHKIFCWLKGENEFYNILTLKMGENEIKRLIKRGLKDKRQKRKTSIEKVRSQIPFYEIYEHQTCKSFLS